MSAVVESAAKPASSGVDNASKAKSALHKIEELSKEIAKNEKVKMCREAWIIFGAALLAQRETMPSTRAYGDWVKEHHLDTGLAKSPVTRADAVWMAAHRRELSELKGLRNHFPSGLRQELRDAGYTWAVKSAGEEEGGDARPADTKVPRRGRAKSQSYRPPHPTTTVGGESDDESTVETSDASTGNDGTSGEDEASASPASPVISREEYETLVQAVDPDLPRADADLLAKALAIVKKLEVLVTAHPAMH